MAFQTRNRRPRSNAGEWGLDYPLTFTNQGLAPLISRRVRCTFQRTKSNGALKGTTTLQVFRRHNENEILLTPFLPV